MVNTTRTIHEPPKGTIERVAEPAPENPMHVVNTTENTLDNMGYEDEEPETLQVLPAGDWCAVLEAAEGSRTIPLAVWVALDDGSMYGVAPHGGEGNIDLTRSIADDPQFKTYVLRKGDR